MSCFIPCPGVGVGKIGRHCPKDLKFHHFIVTPYKTFLELHIPQQPVLAGEIKVPHSTSRHSPSITWRRKLSSTLFSNLLDCLYLAMLSLQQTLGWFPIQTRNCDAPIYLQRSLSAQSCWSYGLQQIPVIISPLPPLPLILIHKLSASSSPIPRQSFMHSSWTLAQRATPISCLTCQSFLKSLYPSIPTLQS